MIMAVIRQYDAETGTAAREDVADRTLYRAAASFARLEGRSI
jgi:hypothetical protein